MFRENPTCTRAHDMSENKKDQKEEEKVPCTDKVWVLKERQTAK